MLSSSKEQPSARPALRSFDKIQFGQLVQNSAARMLKRTRFLEHITAVSGNTFRTTALAFRVILLFKVILFFVFNFLNALGPLVFSNLLLKMRLILVFKLNSSCLVFIICFKEVKKLKYSRTTETTTR